MEQTVYVTKDVLTKGVQTLKGTLIKCPRHSYWSCQNPLLSDDDPRFEVILAEEDVYTNYKEAALDAHLIVHKEIRRLWLLLADISDVMTDLKTFEEIKDKNYDI